LYGTDAIFISSSGILSKIQDLLGFTKAADLFIQFRDPEYLHAIFALLYEFEE